MTANKVGVGVAAAWRPPPTVRGATGDAERRVVVGNGARPKRQPFFCVAPTTNFVPTQPTRMLSWAF